MQYKYFGSIKNPAFFEMTRDEQNNYLLEKKLFRVSYSVSFIPNQHIDDNVPGQINFKTGLSEDNKEFIASDELTDSIYKFILNTYEAYLKHAPILFHAKFNNTVFGFSEKKKKKLALKEFKRIYKECLPGELDAYRNRFGVLYGKRNQFKELLISQRSIILAFLRGEIYYFNRNTFESTPILHQIIDFEANLEILLNLNKTYQFEEDSLFNGKDGLRQLYEKYEKLFKDFTTYKFVHHQIESFEDVIPARIESLHEVLRSNNLLNGNKEDFMKFLLDVHGIRITKIRDYSNLINDKHSERVEFLQEEWHNFP
ncbi:hypothetical protein [Kriegella aquimaris]|uniref:Uncharacterized protein n=1 Tax=Kriegella aquimaris TaxID=192904 RepID=A0A1G9UZM9_9FLAO|nr:hypothetical protein [Kriegella aquimaris]SDM65451.1 hypothetical protein SAMN04488514_11250 [Kriegella aquimaris]